VTGDSGEGTPHALARAVVAVGILGSARSARRAGRPRVNPIPFALNGFCRPPPRR